MAIVGVVVVVVVISGCYTLVGSSFMADEISHSVRICCIQQCRLFDELMCAHQKFDFDVVAVAYSHLLFFPHLPINIS